MKVLLLGLLLVGAYAAEWDLADVSSNDWTKAAAVESGANQGFKARYTTQGKLLKLSLAVHKEKDVRVTDTDRLLFGMSGSNSQHEKQMANATMSRVDTEELCKRALGEGWEKMISLPAEDLTYIEQLRLAASLNEYNLLATGNPIRKNQVRGYGHEEGSHDYPSDFDCICHATSHRFPWAASGPGNHDTPFWGVRLLQRYTRHTDPGHSVHGIPNCILCDHNDIAQDDTAAGFQYDCRWCCSGECVIGLDGESDNDFNPGWINCDFDFTFDEFRVTVAPTDDITFNYYRINDVGSCRLPRVYQCVEEVHRWCETCDVFLAELTSDSESDFLTEFENCHYCDLVVGANPYICNNCSHAMLNIEAYENEFRTPTTNGCSCDNAMAHVANSDRYSHEGDYEGDHHEGDHHEGDHYENYDYDYRGYDYDYRGYDYDYRGDGYESHDYRPSDYRTDYDYRGDGYESHDYRPYDYDYRGDGYESHDYRPSDYRTDYDYRGDGYESHDYRPSDYRYDYDYRGDGYESHDYRPYDYDYRGDGYESHDYRPSDYRYDYDYRGDGYESHDYRPSDYRTDYDYRGDGYESHDYRPSYDYNYRG